MQEDFKVSCPTCEAVCSCKTVTKQERFILHGESCCFEYSVTMCTQCNEDFFMYGQFNSYLQKAKEAYANSSALKATSISDVEN